MKRITPILAGALLALSTSAFSAEFNNQCAWGLANGKNVPTDCKINMTRSDGKTYCFSSDEAMDNFMKSPTVNLKKAQEKFGRA
ncbi:MAG TPA: hypothetical protein VFB54_17795 [Burkholderiales bacterium]|nr:hypothetical protein [Burkholderiales bacterium]